MSAENHNSKSSVLIIKNQAEYSCEFNFLKEKGIDISFADDNESALSLIIEKNPQVIIISVDKNKTQTFENSRKFRFSREAINIVFVFMESRSKSTNPATPELLSKDANEFSSSNITAEDFQNMIIRLFEDKSFYNEYLLESKLRFFLELVGIGIHDVNQPLTSILCNTELILRSINETDPSKKRVDVIYHSITKVIEIMREIQMLKRDVIKHVQKEVYILDL